MDIEIARRSYANGCRPVQWDGVIKIRALGISGAMQIIRASQKHDRTSQLPREMRIEIDIGQLNVLAKPAGIVGRVRQSLQETTKAFLPAVRYARSRGPMPAGCRQVETSHQGSSVVIEKCTCRVMVRIDRHERRKCWP